MLFEWECAYFMSSAITTPTTVSTTTAVSAMVASSNATAVQGDLNEVTVPAILLSNDHTPKSNGTSNEVVEYEQQQHQQKQESPQLTEVSRDQSPPDSNNQQKQQEEQQSPQLTEVSQDQPQSDSNIQQQQDQQKEQESPEQEQQQNGQLAEVPPDPTVGDSKSLQKEQHQEQHQKQKEPQISQIELIRRKRLKLKPWFKQISAEEIPAEKKSQTDSEIIPEPAQSVSAPEATATRKSKSKSGTSSKKVSLKTRKASLSAIVFKQLMAAGGQGIGVGINKDLPPAARQRPPVRRVPAVPPPADGVEVVDVKKSSSKTLSSESSGDPIPEHFGSTFEES